MDYELIVLGGDRAGRRIALTAAERGCRVALIEPARRRFGEGSGLDAELVLDAARTLVARRGGNSRPVAMRDLRRTVDELRDARERNDAERLEATGIDVFRGSAGFAGPHVVDVTRTADVLHLAAERFVVATGTSPRRPSWVPFDGRRVFDPDDLLTLERLPESLAVVGRDVTASRYAAAFETLGVQVAVLSGDSVVGITSEGGRGTGVLVETLTGRKTVAAVLYAAERTGNADRLDLSAIDLVTDDTGRLWCDDRFRTWTNHVYAIGDVVGFADVDADVAAQCELVLDAAFGAPHDRVPTPHAFRQRSLARASGPA